MRGIKLPLKATPLPASVIILTNVLFAVPGELGIIEALIAGAIISGLKLILKGPVINRLFASFAVPNAQLAVCLVKTKPPLSWKFPSLSMGYSQYSQGLSIHYW